MARLWRVVGSDYSRPRRDRSYSSEENENRIAIGSSLSLFCALAMHALQHDSHPHLGNQSADDPDWSELTSSMEKMHNAMAAEEPSTDVDFVRLMLPHHRAALDMAKTQLLYGNDPQMRSLAQEILTDQQAEIQLMQLWLHRHDPQK